MGFTQVLDLFQECSARISQGCLYKDVLTMTDKGLGFVLGVLLVVIRCGITPFRLLLRFRLSCKLSFHFFRLAFRVSASACFP